MSEPEDFRGGWYIPFLNKEACKTCGLYQTPEGHDPCIANLPGVKNACCGHGNSNVGYIQFVNGKVIRFNTTYIEFDDKSTLKMQGEDKGYYDAVVVESIGSCNVVELVKRCDEKVDATEQ